MRLLVVNRQLSRRFNIEPGQLCHQAHRLFITTDRQSANAAVLPIPKAFLDARFVSHQGTLVYKFIRYCL